MNDMTVVKNIIVEIEIEGITPLIPHMPLSERTCVREDTTPEAALDRMYRLPDGTYGIPASFFKGQMVGALRFLQGVA